MSVLDIQKEFNAIHDSKVGIKNWWKTKEISNYSMTDDEHKTRTMIQRHFTLGDVTMQQPRVEFNDLSIVGRMMVDQMAFNTYQPNNGNGNEGDEINSWKSKALRPIVRNKCISIAAHATARIIFPKIFAFDEQNDEQRMAAQVMEDLMEWSCEQSNYSKYSLYRTVVALTDPASIGYSEYSEVYRTVKRVDDDGKITEERILDEVLSGFQDVVVPVNELYIENFYEPDIQKQGWLLWRRVQSYSMMEAKYGHLPNFKYVYPGVQLIYNDANQSFYKVYDTNMRTEMSEEVIYFNRLLDLKIIIVNGVMLTPWNNPMPRNDKRYPFDKFGYELINSKCFYYKSLAFKMQHDANIINTLYPMIIDGTYLSLMPPMISQGGEIIGSDVIVPGAVTMLSDPNATITPIRVSENLQAGMNTLFKVDESINESSQEPIMQGNQSPGNQTAYEISRLENNANTVLGLFIQMREDHVRQFGKLRIGDILQYLTLPEVDEIEQSDLVYKTFLLPNKASGGAYKTRKVKFEANMPENINEDEELKHSYDILKEQEKQGGKMELYKVNPELFRKMRFMVYVNPDVMTPKSSDLERAFKLEIYDRAIANPTIDQEQATRDFLLGAYDISRKDPNKYIAKQQPLQTQQPGMPGQMPQGKPQSPIDMAMQAQPVANNLSIKR